MVNVETSVFTKQLLDHLNADEYRKVPLYLAKRPEAGAVIEGSGAVRVIYYWAVRVDRLLLLLSYAKGDVDDLMPRQVAVLRRIVQ